MSKCIRKEKEKEKKKKKRTEEKGKILLLHIIIKLVYFL